MPLLGAPHKCEKCGKLLRSSVLCDCPWQPINTMPEDGKQYLVRSADGKYSVLNKPEGCFIGEWEQHNGEWYGHSVHGDYKYWKELPK